MSFSSPLFLYKIREQEGRSGPSREGLVLVEGRGGEDKV
jgi:hypothetical protein